MLMVNATSVPRGPYVEILGLGESEGLTRRCGVYRDDTHQGQLTAHVTSADCLSQMGIRQTRTPLALSLFLVIILIVLGSVPYGEGELTTEPQRHGAVFALRGRLGLRYATPAQDTVPRER